MRRIIRPGRLAALAVLLLAFVALYATGLYKLQIVEGKIYANISQNSIQTTRTVTAARGNILDRYGRLLVSNRTCNNLVLNTDVLYAGDAATDGAANAAILQLVNTVLSCGDTYNDTLPVTKTPPFEYIDNMSDIQRTILNAFIKENKLPSDETAVGLMAYFRSRYDIDNNYGAADMRTIAGIRYETNTRYLSTVHPSPYVFAQDVSIQTVTELLESGLQGFEVQQSYVREYNTQYAAQILGYVGMMNDTDYYGADGASGYKALGYPYGAIVGKDGAERAFESYLHGTDGTAVDTRTADGTLVNTTYTKAPVPGDNVYLTIDIGMQEAGEVALASNIQAMNAARTTQNAINDAAGQPDKDMQLSTGGAVVAIDIATGEPLCIASYPTFDPSDYMDQTKFQALLDDTVNKPLFNRALMGTYPPGSTFKPITGLAIMSDPTNVGKINLLTTVFDKVKYTHYEAEGYAPSCWYPYGHGDENLTDAVRDSCNYYFFTITDNTGVGNQNINDLAATAKDFGLGQPTGIELTEATGQMASPETKAKDMDLGTFERQWFSGDTLSACIGQSISIFTPLQLANYVAAFASDGNHYKVSMLKDVRSFDYSQDIYQHAPTLLNKCDYDLSIYQAIQEGMREEVNSAKQTQAVHDAFATASYTVAAKTGTAQLGPGQTNNGVFICFAPFDHPEIAVAVAVEKGGSGAALADIARAVLDYYFNFKNSTTAIDKDLTLLK